MPKGKAAARQAIAIDGGVRDAQACGRAGLPSEAADMIGQLEQDYAGSAGDSVAMVFVGLNDYDKAFQWLSQGFEERGGFMAFVPSWVVWHPLRADPRFHALLQRMNFPQQP